MKQFLWAILGLSIIFTQCVTEKEDLVCTGDCVFTKENAKGTMIYMDCFSRYAIKTTHPDSVDYFIYAIPDKMNSRFEEEGKEVTFTGVFRENTLTPGFPDPSFSPNSIFQVDIKNMD